MRICLYNSYAVVASRLTWEQVLAAEELANASEAGEHLSFYRHTFADEPDSVRRWSLLAKPLMYDRRMADNADDSGWWIEIPDAPSPLQC